LSLVLLPETYAPMVLAINDGDDPEYARAAAAEAGITATVVTDPRREIGIAYGVTLWPTIITLSESGIVSGIKHGHVPGEGPTLPTKPIAPGGRPSKRAS
jgi:hypothetical protein